MRFFVAKGALLRMTEVLWGGRLREAVAEPRLESLGGVGGLGKAVAEPPHSKSSRRSDRESVEAFDAGLICGLLRNKAHRTEGAVQTG
jgi:hypothetical protein